MKKLISTMLLCAAALAPANSAAALIAAADNTPASRIEREVRHELLMLPYYTVFDDFAFRVDGSTVTLLGNVTQPVLKDEAERAVKKIEGVETVKNEIHVLPLSPFDDRLRVAAFRAVYGAPELNRYAHQAMPPIHIIVENGRITLEGVVANEFDRNLAYMKALGVHGAFSVANHLKTEQQS
ncbi:MAG TPA: BON domain-containing protein [Bryobacteraceae bacterium]|nr:BON domain-containing protein [Bryobacteraceae bacterium]